jgi:NADH dehydrogenase
LNLVAGATGRLGGDITRRLLHQGKQVRILVRHDSPSEQLAPRGLATSAHSLIDLGAQPVYGDLKEPESLQQAVEGIQTLVTTANSALRGGEDNPQTVDLEGNRSLIEAAEQAGVKHFVFVSALGADVDDPILFVRAKALTEQRLREGGLDHTIIAPAAFMEVWLPMVVGLPAAAGQPVTLIRGARSRQAFISQSDVAAFAVAALDNPVAQNQRLAIGGPQALSWPDVVQKYEQILGRTVEVRYVEIGELVPGLGDQTSKILSALETSQTDHSGLDTTELARTFGVQLTPLEEVIRRTLASPA